FMIVPLGAETYSEALRMGAETYQSLKGVLKAAGLSTAVGDEGGFAPDLACNAHALDVIMEAIKQAGYRPGSEIALALDVAATALVEGGKYRMAAEDPPVRDTTSMTQYYEDLVGQYPIVSIEDGMGEDDTEGWKTLTAVLGSRIQLVGDDNFVTHPAAIAEGAKEGIANAVLIKLNQIGTLTETFQAVEVARSAGFSQVVSHRSGETEDTSIADFTVAVGCGQIKSGAPCRSERVAKYNRLLRIEKELGSGGRFAGTAPYQYRSAAQR
ncbi:MAG: phosphopyruvate hydratase, partial [Acidobacteriota bacterium]